MRLAVGMLAVLLAPSVALAEDAAPRRVSAAGAESDTAAPARPKVPIRVVRILKDTNQALLYDRTAGSHLLVTVGEKVGIYTVEAIDDDEVTLSADQRQIVLAAPDRPWRRRGAEDRTPPEQPRAVRGGEPAPADPYAQGPVDPYATPSPAAPSPGTPRGGGPSPADPYAEEIREVKAPRWVDPPAPAVPAPSAPAPSAPAAIAPASPGPAPTVAPAPASPPAIAPAPGETVLSRREVDAALANFGALSVAFRASFTPAGVKVESLLDGSLFSKAGLRAGDVIASVDGKPLRSLDDVAALYARAGALRTVTAQVVRGGKPLTLRVVIQ